MWREIVPYGIVGLIPIHLKRSINRDFILSLPFPKFFLLFPEINRQQNPLPDCSPRLNLSSSLPISISLFPYPPDGGRTLGNLNLRFLSQDRVWESLPRVSHPKHTGYSKCSNNNFHYQSLTENNNTSLGLK